MGYRASARPTWATLLRPDLKTNKQTDFTKKEIMSGNSMYGSEFKENKEPSLPLLPVVAEALITKAKKPKE